MDSVAPLPHPPNQLASQPFTLPPCRRAWWRSPRRMPSPRPAAMWRAATTRDPPAPLPHLRGCFCASLTAPALPLHCSKLMLHRRAQRQPQPSAAAPALQRPYRPGTAAAAAPPPGCCSCCCAAPLPSRWPYFACAGAAVREGGCRWLAACAHRRRRKQRHRAASKSSSPSSCKQCSTAPCRAEQCSRGRPAG